MIIADHHKTGSWRSADTDYVPSCAWPADCYVQWGASGIVGTQSGTCYTTAFFEAFPTTGAGGFIRGEGADIAGAERDAFQKFERQFGCQHRFGRRGYLNGGALCYHCNAFRMIFSPVHVFGEWRKPLNKIEQSCLELAPQTQAEAIAAGIDSYLHRKLQLRKSVFGCQES